MERKKDIAKEIAQTLPTFLRHMFPYVFEPISLPPSQVIALVSIQERKQCSLTDLCKEMHVTAPTVTGIVDRLERDGYVKRVHDTSDRRVIHVILTQKGLSIVEQFRKNIQSRWEYILSKMPAGMGEAVIATLRKLTRGFIDGML